MARAVSPVSCFASSIWKCSRCTRKATRTSYWDSLRRCWSLSASALSLPVIGLSDPNLPGNEPGGIGLVFTMIGEHFLISTTMLAVGLFAVLSWDATFPDKRDVLVLAPLPVRARTIFLAKVAAVAPSLCLTDRSAAQRDGLNPAAGIRLARRAGRASRR